MNKILITFDPNSDKKISISKNKDIDEPKNEVEAKKMLNDDIDLLTDSLCLILSSSIKLGLTDKNKKIEEIKNKLNLL